MQTHYIFVDYENTLLGNLGLIAQWPDQPKLKLFLNRHQSMIPLATARALHAMGENAEYIQIDSGRRNVIEFNIAFQLGELATQHPDARFTILSNDTGFNEIVEGLKSKGIACERFVDMETALEQLVGLTPALQEALQDDKVVAIKDGLKAKPPKNSAQN